MKQSKFQILATAFVCLSAMPVAMADTYYWDTNGAVSGTGGTGSYSSTSTRWTTDPGGATATVALASGLANDYIFDGTAGIVTLNGSFSGNSIAFNTNGYTLTTGTAASTTRTLSLITGATGTFNLAAGVNLTVTSFADPAPFGINISTPIIGTPTSSVTVAGPVGTELATLSGLSTYGGGTTVSGGTLKLGVSSTFGGGLVVSGPTGTGAVTLANGVSVDPGTANRVLGATTFFVNGDVKVGNAATSFRLLLDGAIDLGGATRTLTLFRNGTVTTEMASGNEAFKLLQQTNGPAVSVSNGTLRLVSDAGITTTYTAAKFDGTATPVAFTGNSGLTIGDRVIASNQSANPFGTAAGALPKLTLEAGSYYNMNDGGTGSLASSVFSLSGAGTVTNLDTNGGTATLTISGSDTTSFSGTLTDGANLNATLGVTTAVSSLVALTHAGEGTLILSGTNNYTGGTKIGAGTVRVNGPASLPAGSTLISGGSAGDSSTLNLGAAGTGYTMNQLSLGGIMRFTGPATGSASLTFTGGGTVFGTTQKKINVAPNVSVILNGANFDLIGSSGNNNRDVELTVDGAMSISAVIQDNASGTSAGFVGNLSKKGAGVLRLSGANTYGGLTTVGGGVLRLDNALSIPGGISATGGTGGIALSGGVIGLTAASGDFTRPLGTGGDEVRWVSGGTGGFAAYGGDRLVNFGGSGTAIAWLFAGSFGAGGITLGAVDSDSTVTVVNPISLSSASRTITVNDGSAAVDAVLSGVISSTAGSLVKTGDGTLSLTGVNTYGGDTTVLAGTLAVNGSSIADANKLVINGGKLAVTGTEVVATLVLDTTSQAAGTYGATGSGAATIDDVHFSGSGMVSVVPPTGFDSWVTTPAFGLAAGDQDPTDDPDSDGMNNLVEYALGGTPNVNDAATIAPTGAISGSNYIYSFKRSDLSEADTTQTVEYGNDLTVWGTYAVGASPGISPVVITEDAPIADLDTVVVTIPTAGAPKFFARLKVVR